MTKGEILNLYRHFSNASTTWLYEDDARKAMDEYAKQQALSFGVFRDKFKREESRRVKEKEKRLGGMITWIGASDEEIYNQFIEQSIK